MAKGTGSKAPPPKKTGSMPPALKKYWDNKNKEKGKVTDKGKSKK